MAKSEKLTRVEILCVEYTDDSTNPRLSHKSMYRVMKRMNVLVDSDPGLKVGRYITLADSENPDQQWLIEKVHETLDRVSINRGWNNNI
jgi:hypothetical protein